MAKGLANKHHQAKRVKAKRKNYMIAEGASERMAHVVAETPSLCSCEMCGNPRKHFGEKTKQEKSFLEQEIV